MLKVENLSFSVMENGKRVNILSDISFQVDRGEMLVITGPNGGGKSTLAKVLMGIEKADSGRVFLDGQDITDMTIDERAEAGIGFAFQQPPRFKGMTVDRLISLAAGEKKSEAECCELLSRVGLCAQEYVKRQVDNTLSGGEMKRLEIATVLAKPHKLCIFDEPEAGIDLWSFSMLIQQFEEIKKDEDQSLILISHQERIMEMADRVMIIEEGRVAGIGKREDILPELIRQGPSCCAYLKRIEDKGEEGING
ncbi:MAG TPA: ATP-binding cassette domain-containing protein [Candidatus Copromorpha excrementigallinarum]|uniref:ATP-binding cassette domain-containing protein n=1 Tax=Candidatus Allocopromorpha excrementigallinarum TaxID=2840742 RepID=A0A9D1I1X0_9FIRM|nr:ATP-binding cassette domain-containing protein [Candidatus Copromorpha excrementigallinarum]